MEPSCQLPTRRLPGLLLMALALTLCAACGQTGLPTAPPSALPTSPIATPTSIPPASTPIARSTPVPIPSVLYPADAGMILEDGAVDLPTETGSFQNQWYIPTSNGEIRVYAGAEKHDAQQGVLFVSVRKPPQPRSIAGYYTPLRAGSVRIISAVGERLTLRADNGTRFTFDVLTRQWIDPTPSRTP